MAEDGDVTTVWAPAKLTLSLRVTGVRADGMHLLDAEMVTLDLADRLDLAPAPASSLTVVDPAGVAPGCTSGPDNLVLRALAAVGATAHVTLAKAIPDGAGLGGGSADAAAVLRWAGVDDPDVAASLGADVAFCVRGGRARVTGIGEVVELLPPEPLDVTLVTPPLHVSTPAVYRAWDDLGGPRSDDPSHPNDLEAAAIAVEPRLATWRDLLAEVTGLRPILAGSGATWWLPGHHTQAIGATGGPLAEARLVTDTRTGDPTGRV